MEPKFQNSSGKEPFRTPSRDSSLRPSRGSFRHPNYWFLAHGNFALSKPIVSIGDHLTLSVLCTGRVWSWCRAIVLSGCTDRCRCPARYFYRADRPRSAAWLPVANTAARNSRRFAAAVRASLRQLHPPPDQQKNKRDSIHLLNRFMSENLPNFTGTSNHGFID